MIAGRIHGEAKLRRAVQMLERRVVVASPFAVKAGADVIENMMHRLAPSLTGRLRARISTSITSAGEGVTARIGSDVPYDPFVQKGTVYMEPQAYGEESAQQGAAAVVAAVAAVYKQALPG